MAATRQPKQQQQQVDESFMTQAPRPKRRPGGQSHAPNCGDAAKGKWKASQRPSSAKLRQRTVVMPPADHHAEKRVLKADAAASRLEATEAASPTAGSKRHRSKWGATAPDTSASDSDADPPRRQCKADATVDTLASHEVDESSLDIPTADTSLFSPTVTLSGGKAAAELPAGPRTATRRSKAGKAATAGASQAGIVLPAIGAPAPETPSRRCPPASHASDTPPPSARLPVCSPAKAASRRVLTFGATKNTAQQQKQQQQRPVQQQQPIEVAASNSLRSNGGEWGDENAPSDTQIRLSPGAGAHRDAMASRSDADIQMPLECRRLMCLDSSASMGGDSSDGELEEDDNEAMNELIQQASLQSQGNQNGVEQRNVVDLFDFDPYLFIRRLPPLTSVVSDFRDILLPCQTRASKMKTLVLDLDETLVHSSLDTPEARPDFTFAVGFGGRVHQVGVQKRPDLDAFLERVAEIFEVVIFTASQKVYAEQLINVLDPRRCLIRHRIFRDSCITVDGNYLKDLSVLGRDLSQTIIVDNSPQAFGYQMANGIPIESWYDDLADRELATLLPFLESLVNVDDVRPVISAAFNLPDRVARALTPQPEF